MLCTQPICRRLNQSLFITNNLAFVIPCLLGDKRAWCHKITKTLRFLGVSNKVHHKTHIEDKPGLITYRNNNPDINAYLYRILKRKLPNPSYFYRSTRLFVPLWLFSGCFD